MKGKAGRGAGIVVGTIMMRRKVGTEIEVIMEGIGAGAGAEIVTGKGGGKGEETMTTRGVGTVTVIAVIGEEDGASLFLALHLPIFVAVGPVLLCH